MFLLKTAEFQEKIVKQEKIEMKQKTLRPLNMLY
jgi:hypothetical protein